MLRVLPLRPSRWKDFAKLFGPRGACAGCWCMWWKLARADWNAGKRGGNRRKMRRAAQGNLPPGLLAYDGPEPVGWIAIEPRAHYARLSSPRLRTLAPLDDQPVWSITCLFVARSHRRRGLTIELLEAAARHARRHGAGIVEGYPIEAQKRQADVFMYTGAASAFRAAGFAEVARRTPSRPIMRLALAPPDRRK